MKKNTLHILLICFCIAFLSLAGVSCSGDVNEDYIELKRALNPARYMVHFDTMVSDYDIEDFIVVAGSKLNKTEINKKMESCIAGSDKNFAAWYSNKEFTKKWDFDKDMVLSDMSLYARWVTKTNCTLKIEVSSDDATRTYLESAGIGTSNTSFSYENIPAGTWFYVDKNYFYRTTPQEDGAYSAVCVKDSGYEFDGWYSETMDKIESDFLLETTSTIIAKFKHKTFSITYSSSPTNLGKVEKGTDKIVYGSVILKASGEYITSGSNVIATATSLDDNYCFSNWEFKHPDPQVRGRWTKFTSPLNFNGHITEDTYPVSDERRDIDFAKDSIKSLELRAIFKPVPYTVSVKTSNLNWGVVNGTLPFESNVEEPVQIKGDELSVGNNVITAVAKSGYRFEGWYVDGEILDETQQYKITTNTTFIANFEQISYNVKVTVAVGNNGNYNGTISGNSFSITTGTELIAEGNKLSKQGDTSTAITATPDDGYYFDGWYLEGSSTSSLNFVVTNTDFEIETRFKPIVYKLTFDVKEPVTDNIAKISSTNLSYDVSIERPIAISNDTVTITSGTDKVVVKAVTSISNGYSFAGWYNGNTSVEANRVDNTREWQTKKIITANTNLTAKFIKKTYTLTLKPSDSHWGTVSATNFKITAQFKDTFRTNKTATMTYVSKGIVVAEAIPKTPGYLFKGWHRDTSAYVGDSFAVTEDMTYVAEFEKEKYTVNVITSNTDDNLGGWITLDDGATTCTTSSFTDVPYYDKSYSTGNVAIEVNGNKLTFGGKTIQAITNCGAYDFDGWYIDGLYIDGKRMDARIQITTNTDIYACYNYNVRFSVSSTKKVDFADGNLKWTGSAFAMESNAYDFTTYTNGGAEVGLFYWTDDATKANNEPSKSASALFANDSTQIGLGSEWRVLTKDEWGYLFNSRIDAASKFGLATVAGVKGVIILPDKFVDPQTNGGSSAFVPTTGSGNVYTAEQWKKMQNNGAVFLPDAGRRIATTWSDIGFYWSSSSNYALQLSDKSLKQNYSYCYAIRLVRDMK